MLVEPWGWRATSEGGKWVHVGIGSAPDHLAVDVGSLTELSAIDRTMTIAEARGMRRRAAAGLLTYGSHGDVERMIAVTDVLEIRMLNRRVGTGEVMHVRLYFSEPADHEDLLVSLLLAWKCPGKIGLREQTRHARMAQQRFEDWTAEQGD